MSHFAMTNMSLDDVLLNRVLDYSPSLFVFTFVIWCVWLASRKLLTYDIRLKSVEGRLDGVEVRLDKVEKRLDKVEARLDKVEERLGKVEERLGRIEVQVNEINHKLTALTAALLATGKISQSHLST
jgi:septal ring factor EnvC (AmiA/AmiB activator)